MTTEPQDNFEESAEPKSESASAPGIENEATDDINDDVEAFYQEQVLSAEGTDDNITNNDGSVTEAFDTAFHNKPGYIEGHSLAGSNRADFYEAREQGKSDAEEEMEYLKKQQE